MAQDNTALLVNVRSRRGSQLFKETREVLRKEIGLKVALSVDRPNELEARLRKLVDDGFDQIIIGGGDGTISSSLPVLAHSGVRLGILPLGTSNTLAKSLGLPNDPLDVCRLIREGEAVDIDLAKANGRYFANSLTIGLSVWATDELTSGLKRYLGLSAYAVAGVRALVKDRAFKVRLVSGPRSEEIVTRQLAVANGPYLSRILKVGPGARLDSRRLVVFTLEGLSRSQFLRKALSFALRRHPWDPEAHYFETERLHIDADPSQKLSLDGETYSRTPVDISIDPAALRVIVSREYSESPERAPQHGERAAIQAG